VYGNAEEAEQSEPITGRVLPGPEAATEDRLIADEQL
jgi:hypothetical protein